MLSRHTVSRRGESGAAAILALMVALLCFTFAALAVDLGNAVSRKGSTQAQADFAALAGAPFIPGTKVATDPAVLAVARYLVFNRPTDDNDSGHYGTPRWPTNVNSMAANLVDNSLSNGEVNFATTGRMVVTTPRYQVDFGFAGIFGMFPGVNVANKIEVSSSATVMTGTPSSYGVYPMYVAAPTAGNPQCDYGLQTLTDPPNGHVVPPAVPTLYADADTNGTSLTAFSLTDSGSAVSTIALNSTAGQMTLSGGFKNATRVGFFSPDDPSLAPVEVVNGTPGWVSPSQNPYTQNNNGQVVVKIPLTVTSSNALWYARVYQGTGAGAGANKWSERSEAQPLSIGDAPFECVGGSSSGNFGTLKLPRAGANPSNASGWIATNIAKGLEAPLSLAVYPGSPPPFICTAAPPSVVSTSSVRRAGTNCLDTDTGMTFGTATPGFISGNGGVYKGRLDTGATRRTRMEAAGARAQERPRQQMSAVTT